MEMDDRDMLESIRAHFASHATLPGEKALKERATYELAQIDNNEPEDARWLDPELKSDMARQLADTRIREFSVTMAGIRPDDLNHKFLGEYEIKNGKIPVERPHGQTVYVSCVDGELIKSGDDVFVHMERADGKYEESPVPDKYLANNPMTIKSCGAEIELRDWSNRRMKNVTAKVVVDVDKMTGDVIDLDNDMLAGLDQDMGLGSIK